MKKVAIITSQKDSEWVSCKSISANLLESYKLALNGKYRLFSINYNNFDSKYATWSTVSDVKNWGADTLVFVDHAPCPANFISALGMIDSEYRPNLVIHVYGDFVLNVSDWIRAEAALANFSIQWICASEKQASLLKRFISEESSKIDICPFPVSDKDYYFDQKAREETRRELNISNAESVFVYSGRLSLQKNILPLIRAFNLYQKNLNSNSLLLMAGPIDDIGMPYLGKTSPPGLMAYDIQTLINTLFSSERQDRIRYLDNLNAKDLNSLYNAADIFISLSTHNDEDYGMAPAEALLTGCPCILTDWGGYSGFKNLFEATIKYIPTKIDEKNILFDQKQLILALDSATNICPINNRIQIASLALKNHSVNSCAKKINFIINREQPLMFKKFNSVFHQLDAAFSVNPEAPFGNGHKFTDLYKDIYLAYQS